MVFLIGLAAGVIGCVVTNLMLFAYLFCIDMSDNVLDPADEEIIDELKRRNIAQDDSGSLS